MGEGAGPTFEVKVHRGRRITIPKAVADLLGIEEGSSRSGSALRGTGLSWSQPGTPSGSQCMGPRWPT